MITFSQTTLMPSVVALSTFFTEHFPNISWYPYWYLGNPFHFLIGPVVPIILSIFHIFGFNIAFSYFFLIIGSFFLGGWGVYNLVGLLGGSKHQRLTSSILYSILPFGYILLNFQNGLHHIAFSLLPFALLFYKKLLDNKEKSETKLIIKLVFLITIMVLVSISILLPLIVGMLLMLFLVKQKDILKALIKSILVLLLAISLSSTWYTLGFWFVLGLNPSFGGIPLINVIKSILLLCFQVLPAIIAIIIVKLKKITSVLTSFSILFFLSFMALSIVRLLANPSFVLDWIGFGLELQFGLSLIVGLFIGKQKFKELTMFLLFAISLFLDFLIIGHLLTNQKDRVYKEEIASMLKKYVKDDSVVFLSGSSVFSLNSNFNIRQIRGGIDEGSVNKVWNQASYQIREGKDLGLTNNWLKALGVSYVLVHDSTSSEYFHDFKYQDKFGQMNLIEEKNGNKLYKIDEASFARLANREILSLQKPTSGNDSENLENYINSLKNPVSFSFTTPSEIHIKTNALKNMVISLAMTYDPRWIVKSSNGYIVSDSLSNLVIIPVSAQEQNFVISYKTDLKDFVIPLILSGVVVIALMNNVLISNFLMKIFSRFSIGIQDTDDY